MERFNNLTKGKKVGIVACLFAILVVVGILVGTLVGGQVKGVVLSKENLSNLIEKEYTVDTLAESSDKKSLEIAIKGDLDSEDATTLAKVLNEKNKSAGWGKEVISVNIFSKDSETVDKNEFYVDGLVYKVVINIEKSNADISKYVSTPSVEKTDVLVDYNNANITTNDGNVVLSLDMDVSKSEEDLLEVVKQAKTFSILFRETNPDKEIKSMEIKINPNDNEKKYNYHTEYENILEVIDCVIL